jgi:hypothetical protein
MGFCDVDLDTIRRSQVDIVVVCKGLDRFLLLTSKLRCGRQVALGWFFTAMNARTGQSSLKSEFLRIMRTFVMRRPQRSSLGATMVSCRSPWLMILQSGSEILSRSEGHKKAAIANQKAVF